MSSQKNYRSVLGQGLSVPWERRATCGRARGQVLRRFSVDVIKAMCLDMFGPMTRRLSAGVIEGNLHELAQPCVLAIFCRCLERSIAGHVRPVCIAIS